MGFGTISTTLSRPLSTKILSIVDINIYKKINMFI